MEWRQRNNLRSFRAMHTLMILRSKKVLFLRSVPFLMCAFPRSHAHTWLPRFTQPGKNPDKEMVMPSLLLGNVCNQGKLFEVITVIKDVIHHGNLNGALAAAFSRASYYWCSNRKGREKIRRRRCDATNGRPRPSASESTVLFNYLRRNTVLIAVVQTLHCPPVSTPTLT